MRLSLVALPIRSYPPKQRGLTLVHSRQSRVESWDTDPEGRTSPDELKSEARLTSESSSVSASDAPAAPPASTSALLKASVPPSSRRAELSDAELVALSRVGESAAFEQLYRRHVSYALSLAVRVQGHPGDVEDIVHDAFLKVHDRLKDLRADASFRPWLAAIVVSLVRTRLRRRRMLSVLGLMQNEPVDLDALINGDAGPEVRAQLAQVYSVLSGVPVDQRICWTLRYIEGRKLEEVAQLADCSLATAKRRIAAVQERLCQGEGASSDEAPADSVEQNDESDGSAPVSARRGRGEP